MPQITVSTGIYKHRILINGIAHLSINIDELVGIQSYHDELNKFTIEYYLKTRTIKCEYDREDTWKEILKLLHEKRIA